MRYLLCETTEAVTAARLAAALVVARLHFRYAGEEDETYRIYVYDADRAAAHKAAMFQEVEVSL